MALRLPDGQFFGRKVVERSTAHLNLVLTSYGRGARLPLHAHERPYLAAVLCGGFEERSAGRDHPCSEGTLVLNTVGAEHSDSFRAERTEVLNVELDPDWIDALREEGFSASSPVWVDGRGSLARLRHLRAHLSRGNALSPFVIEGLCAELLGHAARPRAARSCRSPSPWPRLAEDVLAERFRRPPELFELSRIVGVGPSQLARSFRARHGCSIGVFTRRLRVEHARQEVVGTRDRLAEIALASGYADQSHMTREFRRLLGCTPGALRGE